MTLKPLDFAFPIMSATSQVRPWQVKLEEQLAELEQELLRRQKYYPLRVERGQMTEAESHRHIAILAAIAADIRWDVNVREYEGGQWERETARRAAAIAACPFTWDDKVRELRRELALRRNKYPGEIERRRLTDLEARFRIERLEAVHWRYWIMLEHFDLPDPADTLTERMALIRTLAHQRDDWLYTETLAGNPAVKHWLTAEQIAHHAAHHAQQAAA